MSAYAILDQLKDRHGVRSPMSVYRALDRLCRRSAVERVETASGYRIRDMADPVLLSCRRCGATTALSAAMHHHALGLEAGSTGFRIERLVLEAVGVCARCSDGDA